MASLNPADEISVSRGWGERSSREGMDGWDDLAYSASMVFAALTIKEIRAGTFPPGAAIGLVGRKRWKIEDNKAQKLIIPKMDQMDPCGRICRHQSSRLPFPPST